eukprot:3997362-Pyramimonas_sp.AAC.1
MESETFKIFAEVLGESIKAREPPKPATAASPFTAPSGGASQAHGSDASASGSGDGRDGSDADAGGVGVRVPDDMELDDPDDTTIDSILTAAREEGFDKSTFF